MREELLKFELDATTFRRAQIINELKGNNIPYELQVNEEAGITNIVVRLNQTGNADEKVGVLGAHYDVVPGSTGLNDNGASIVMLIDFIKTHGPYTKAPLEIVFFDKEETGMIGSYEYTKVNGHRIQAALIFDIIAFGDVLLFGTRNANVAEWLVKKTTFKPLRRILPSDNTNFSFHKIPNALITAAPYSDLKLEKDGTYSLVGSSFYETFHNRRLDNNIDVLNMNLIKEAAISLSSLF